MASEMECRRIPKLELHAHLNGSMSLRTIEKLRGMRNSSCLSLKNLENDVKLEQPTTMEEVFKIFPLIQSIITSKEAVKIATIDVIKEFAEDCVVYLELRSTPKTTIEMSRKDYVDALIEGVTEGSKSIEMVTKLILSIDRRQSVEEAEQTVEIAAADETGLIVGVELSGNPAIDGRKFLPILERARNIGLKVSVHLAEIREQLDEVEEFLAFRPDRIGHGTFLNTQNKYVQAMVDQHIPLEICLSSNVLSMTTSSIEDSHLKFWRDKSIPFCLCTDDKGLMNCDLSTEYFKASNAFGFTVDDFWKISKDALEMSFLDKCSDEYRKLEYLLDQQKFLGCNWYKFNK